jgi:hypothetical protein
VQAVLGEAEQPDLAPDLAGGDMAGDVELRGDMREVFDSEIGYHAERIVAALRAGPATWLRFTAYAGQLEERQWVPIDDFDVPDLSLRPEWLVDPAGPKVVRADWRPRCSAPRPCSRPRSA